MSEGTSRRLDSFLYTKTTWRNGNELTSEQYLLDDEVSGPRTLADPQLGLFSGSEVVDLPLGDRNVRPEHQVSWRAISGAAPSAHGPIAASRLSNCCSVT